MAADFSCEQPRQMCRQQGLALTLSLALHLGLLLGVGLVLPHSMGENQIFQVYLAADASGFPGGALARQTQAEPQHSLSTTSGPASSADSPSAAVNHRPTEEISKTALPSAKKDAAVQRQPSRKPAPHVKEIVHIAPAGSKIIAKAAVVKEVAPARATSSPVGSVTGKGAEEKSAGTTGTRAEAPSSLSSAVSGTSRQGLGKNYLAMVLARIEAAKRYPRPAIRRRLEGSSEVVFRLDEKGALLAVGLAGSSGYHTLDQAALAAVNRAAPFPPLPEGGRSIPHTFKITISFILSHEE